MSDRFSGPSPIGGGPPDDGGRSPNRPPESGFGPPSAPPPSSWQPQGPPPGQFPPGQFPPGPQQFGQYPPPGPQGPSQGGHPGPWMNPQPPARRGGNKKVLLAIAAAVVVVVVVVVSVIFLRGSGGGGGAEDTAAGVDLSSASASLKGYLEALARGDAKAALAYGAEEPADTTFLTDEILKTQLEKTPITNIRILDSNDMGPLDMVHVSVNFGDKTSDETIMVNKVGDNWPVPYASYKFDMGDFASAENLSRISLFGKPVTSDAISLFPGAFDFQSTNPNLVLTTDMSGVTTLGFMTLGYVRAMPSFGISKKGQTAVMDGIKAALVECAKTNDLNPKNCPQNSVMGYADGSAQWTAPTDLSPIQIGNFEYDSTSLTVKFFGLVDFGLTARTQTGEPVTTDEQALVDGTADLSQSPPKITLGR